MSRCFPFPPPGYEKKIKTEKADPLIKEKDKDKQKEKKHKKDKDKEKKEGKEKKNKDRSKDKEKERREKKEKRKDRKDQEKDKEKRKPLEEKKTEVLPNTGQNNINGESKYIQDLARRISYQEEATGSQSAQNISYPNQKDLVVTGKAFENSSFYPIPETNHSEDDHRRTNTQKTFAVAKSSENAVARVSSGADHKRVEAMGKPKETIDQARQMVSPEKSHPKESVTKSDKPWDKEGVKKYEADGKVKYKEEKEDKKESIKEKPRLVEGSKLEEREKNSLDIRNPKPPDLSRVSVKNHIVEGNIGKRKDHETNGFLYENGTTPNKLQRNSVSVSSIENGRTSSAHPTPPMSASEVKSCKPDFKEVRINGFIDSREKQKVYASNSLAATMKVNGEALAKPPHPDLKYLEQILNVPKRELLPAIDDDQKWLCSQSGVKLKKTRTDSPDSAKSLQVWNQAFRIESADIVALPYVVPF